MTRPRSTRLQRHLTMVLLSMVSNPRLPYHLHTLIQIQHQKVLLPVQVLMLTHLSQMALLYLAPRIVLVRLTCTAKSVVSTACYNNATAGFIAYDDDDLYDRPTGKAAEEGRAATFDFDSLPVRDGEDAPCICAAVPAVPSSVALPLSHPQEEKQPELKQPSPPLPAPVVSAVPDSDVHYPQCTELKSPSAFLRRAQYKCSRNSVIGLIPAAIPANQRYKSQATQPRVVPPHTIEIQHQRVRHVPAFGPLTKVLNPVVTRAQWEIVVRSAFAALFISLIIVGSLLTVPVRR